MELLAVAALALHAGVLDLTAGNEQAAAASLRTALDFYESLADVPSQIDTLTALAIASQTEPDPGAAYAHLGRAQRLLAAVGDSKRASGLEVAAGKLLIRDGRGAEACNRMCKAIDLARQAGDPLLEADARHALADALTGLGDAEGARTHREWAAALRRSLGDPSERAHTVIRTPAAG
jgi:tetratricopeptide (TPR) repeat protein